MKKRLAEEIPTKIVKISREISLLNLTIFYDVNPCVELNSLTIRPDPFLSATLLINFLNPWT